MITVEEALSAFEHQERVKNTNSGKADWAEGLAIANDARDGH